MRMITWQRWTSRTSPSCASFLPDLSKATRSHHFKVLREAGLTRTRVEGTSKYVRLRADLADRFPGLLDSVLTADTAPSR